MNIQPYLSLDGRCEEALEFYRKAVGARVETMMRFRESPEPLPPGMVPPGAEDKILHAEFRIGDSVLMASDGSCGGTANFQGFSLTLNVHTADEANRCFTALSEGGRVTMPLGPTFWSPRFGTLTDRFGIGWLINVVP